MRRSRCRPPSRPESPGPLRLMPGRVHSTHLRIPARRIPRSRMRVRLRRRRRWPRPRQGRARLWRTRPPRWPLPAWHRIPPGCPRRPQRRRLPERRFRCFRLGCRRLGLGCDRSFSSRRLRLDGCGLRLRHRHLVRGRCGVCGLLRGGALRRRLRRRFGCRLGGRLRRVRGGLLRRVAGNLVRRLFGCRFGGRRLRRCAGGCLGGRLASAAAGSSSTGTAAKGGGASAISSRRAAE